MKDCVVGIDDGGVIQQQCIQVVKEYHGELPNKYSLYSLSRRVAKHFFPKKKFPGINPDPVYVGLNIDNSPGNKANYQYSRIFDEYFAEQQYARDIMKADHKDLPNVLLNLNELYNYELKFARFCSVAEADKMFKSELQSGDSDIKTTVTGIFRKMKAFLTDYVISLEEKERGNAAFATEPLSKIAAKTERVSNDSEKVEKDEQWLPASTTEREMFEAAEQLADSSIIDEGPVTSTDALHAMLASDDFDETEHSEGSLTDLDQYAIEVANNIALEVGEEDEDSWILA
ncbi:hypothetical protein EAF04_007174 [Stromatinia cepivora]|nr:hypothetical protein EAF04_007174 [Stromatinia cepivora]